MPAEITFPVYMRVGEQPEFRLGEFTVDLATGIGSLTYGRPELAAMMRAAADEITNPSHADEEVPDAAP
ncbi:hypothetical protein GKQ77_01680 [Streptomyces sp. BG9H]|uniref:Uncharacterized protein n=1 Tax=Streptomyces anatolicus TaxID=2675858 RepID=A0ABS6YI72_9ACTN|nr:hypothetical protein [Streptomyces anatolicus]MBW5420281.1 hypothetical protein [Streptomyces anatolicus]